MKRILLTIALIAMLAIPASAADPVFSLWGDENMSVCGVEWTGAPYFSYDVYVFVEGATAEPWDPGEYGIQTVEYRIASDLATFPDDLFIANTPNPALPLNLTQGDWVGGAGITAGYTNCNYGTFWVAYLTVTNWTTGDHSVAGNWYLEALPTDPANRVAIATCATGYPKMNGDVYNHFGYNQGCTIGTKETSWGAIKSMY